jgi:hypothetical protein
MPPVPSSLNSAYAHRCIEKEALFSTRTTGQIRHNCKFSHRSVSLFSIEVEKWRNPVDILLFAVRWEVIGHLGKEQFGPAFKTTESSYLRKVPW